MRKVARKVGPIAAASVVGAVAVAAASYFQPYPVSGDKALLEASASVKVERGPYGLAFVPAEKGARTGIVFYAGARVPPEAYAYLGRSCAEAGFTAVFPSFPLNFAIFDPDKARDAIAAFPEVERWVAGGHSLGGAMACAYASGGETAGLFLLAAYPGGKTDLSASGLPAVSVSASADGLATPRKVAAARSLMPAGARYVEIAGGNHAQFGEYGAQKGDGAAEISGPAQRRVVVEEALALLGGLESRAGE